MAPVLRSAVKKEQTVFRRNTNVEKRNESSAVSIQSTLDHWMKKRKARKPSATFILPLPKTIIKGIKKIENSEQQEPLTYFGIQSSIHGQRTANPRLHLFHAAAITTAQRLLSMQISKNSKGPLRALTSQKGNAKEGSSCVQTLLTSDSASISLFCLRALGFECLNRPDIDCTFQPDIQAVLYEDPCPGMEITITFASLSDARRAAGHLKQVTIATPIIKRQRKTRKKKYTPPLRAFIPGVVMLRKDEEASARTIIPNHSEPTFVHQDKNVKALVQRPVDWQSPRWSKDFKKSSEEGIRIGDVQGRLEGPVVVLRKRAGGLRLGNEACAFALHWGYTERVELDIAQSKNEEHMGKMTFTSPVTKIDLFNIQQRHRFCLLLSERGRSIVCK